MSWRLADRSLDLAQPLAAGIVNVTADSMFEGARSITPEQAVRDGHRRGYRPWITEPGLWLQFDWGA